MVKAIVNKLRDAETRAENLVKDAEAKAGQNAAQFDKAREKRLQKMYAESDALREKALKEADARAKQEETQILADAQKEMNTLRAAADKRKEEAISLIIRKILEQ